MKKQMIILDYNFGKVYIAEIKTKNAKFTEEILGSLSEDHVSNIIEDINEEYGLDLKESEISYMFVEGNVDISFLK